jgi:hypothetical protein
MLSDNHLFGCPPDDQILEAQRFANQLFWIGFLGLNIVFSVFFALIGSSVLQILLHIFLSAFLVFSYSVFFFSIIGHNSTWYLSVVFILVSYGFFIFIHSNNFGSYVVASTLLFMMKSAMFGFLGGLVLYTSPISVVGAVDDFLYDFAYPVHKRIYGSEPQVY